MWSMLEELFMAGDARTLYHFEQRKDLSTSVYNLPRILIKSALHEGSRFSGC